MFDLVRTVGLVWLLVVASRARSWTAVWGASAMAYILALEVASGITIRNQGPMVPVLSMVLVFIGPSAMPRGPLTPLPHAHSIVAWPSVVDGLACVALAILSWRISQRVSSLPVREEDRIRQTSRVALALMASAVCQGLLVAFRLLPALMGGEVGNGNVE